MPSRREFLQTTTAAVVGGSLVPAGVSAAVNEASPPFAKTLERFLCLYEQGVIVDVELERVIASKVFEPDFFNHMDRFPDFVIRYLRDCAARAAGHPEDSQPPFVAGAFAFTSDEEAREYERLRRESNYWIERRLREHFMPCRPLPKFEPVKLLGTINEVFTYEDKITTLDDLNSLLIRDNPVHLVSRDGTTVITTAESTRVLRDVELASECPVTRQWGRWGLAFGDEISRVEQVPPGTELWVNRSANSEIPPPPVD